ncbi:competence protein CoiA family protein [Cyanothece sp. BG0011]|uniref:competence protein CoiA family protein n=1 Tax=Cyanothece sp. BG0011 TaxID=2082950 RepID=UPI000D1E7821|nr:competence protein CoiA family protein [Cyanothece sp. BG0011]
MDKAKSMFLAGDIFFADQVTHEDSRDKFFLCTKCNEPVFLKKGIQRRPHFSHYREEEIEINKFNSKCPLRNYGDNQSIIEDNNYDSQGQELERLKQLFSIIISSQYPNFCQIYIKSIFFKNQSFLNRIIIFIKQKQDEILEKSLDISGKLKYETRVYEKKFIVREIIQYLCSGQGFDSLSQIICYLIEKYSLNEENVETYLVDYFIEFLSSINWFYNIPKTNDIITNHKINRGYTLNCSLNLASIDILKNFYLTDIKNPNECLQFVTSCIIKIEKSGSISITIYNKKRTKTLAFIIGRLILKKKNDGYWINRTETIDVCLDHLQGSGKPTLKNTNKIREQKNLNTKRQYSSLFNSTHTKVKQTFREYLSSPFLTEKLNDIIGYKTQWDFKYYGNHLVAIDKLNKGKHIILASQIIKGERKKVIISPLSSDDCPISLNDIKKICSQLRKIVTFKEILTQETKYANLQNEVSLSSL